MPYQAEAHFVIELNTDKVARLFFRLSLLLPIIFTSACYSLEISGPLALSEVRAVASEFFPVHYPNSFAIERKEVGVVYYYFDNDSELRLDTYFTMEDSKDGNIRVAKMSTYNVATALVTPGETTDMIADVDWAQDGEAYICQALSLGERDLVAGPPYQSCMYWFDQDGWRYKIYTIWPDNKMVALVNSLSISK